MTSLSHLAQYLLRLGPQESTARLAFYHYVKNFLALESELTPDTLKRFYNFALSIEYWQDKRVELGQRIAKDLRNFAKDHRCEKLIEPIIHSDILQVIQLENETDGQALVKNHIQKKLGNRYRIQVKAIEDKRILLLALSPDDELLVETFSLSAVIRDGGLEPLGPLTRLVYNERMEIMSDREHCVETGVLSFCRFSRQGDTYFANHIQNFGFQKVTSTEGQLSKDADLFCALKRIERHFVNLETDPFYQEIVSLLEKATRQLKSDMPESVSFAHRALDRGQTALHRIFIDDKLLLVLVSNLENRLLERKKRFAERLSPQVEKCQKLNL